MIKFNKLVRKKENVSREDFRAFWFGEHAQKSIELAPDLGIRKYIICETQHDDEVNKNLQAMYGTASDCYDMVDHMEINDFDVFKTGLESKSTQKKIRDLHELCSEYLNFERSDYWFTNDVAQVFSREKVTATWTNTHLKIFYVPRRHPHVSLEGALLHWNACHGALARQFVDFLPYDKYFQAHKIESPHTDKFKALTGAKYENISSIIGQAEAWLDRHTFPRLVGPEVERMFSMLGVDIDLFVDAPDSHIFAAKEFTMLDQEVIIEPVPSLFSLD